MPFATTARRTPLWMKRSLPIGLALLVAGGAHAERSAAVPLLWKTAKAGAQAHLVSFGFARSDGMHWFVFVYSQPIKVRDIRNVYIDADMDSQTGYSKAGGSDYILAVVSKRMSFFAGHTEEATARFAIDHAYQSGNAVVVGVRDVRCEGVSIRARFRVMMNTNHGKVPYFSVDTTRPLAANHTITLPQAPPGVGALGRRYAPEKLTVTICDGNRRIESPIGVPTVRQLEVSGARNEFVPFQVVVFVPGPRQRGNIALTWTDLAGERGRIPKAMITAQTVDAVPLWEPVAPELKYAAGAVHASEPHRLTRVPDRLLAYEEGATITGGKGYLNDFLKAFWMTVYVPLDTRPGTYRGTTRVTVTDAPDQEVAVRLKVRSFSIPERPSLTVFGDLPRFAQYESTRFSFPKPERAKPYKLNYERCAEDLASHRLALRSIGIDPELIFAPDGTPRLDFTGFDGLAHYVFSELRMNAKPAVPFAWTSTGHGYRFNPHFGPIGKNHISDEFKRKYVATMRAIAAHLRAKGWLDDFRAFVSDEPHYNQLDEMRTAVQMLREADPGLEPWYYGHAFKRLRDIFDTWMIPASAFKPRHHTHRLVRELCEQGDRVGVYNPRECYVVNVPPAYLRTLYWWAYRRNLSWMSQWTFGGSYILRNFSCQNSRYWTAWVYPPTRSDSDIWDGSIRWELTREGLEDYEYLKLLEKRSKEALSPLPAIPEDVFSRRSLPLEYIRPVAHSYLSRTHDSALVTTLRDWMAEEIEQLSRPPVFLCTYRISEAGVILAFAGKPGTRVDYLDARLAIPAAGHIAVDLPRDVVGARKALSVRASLGGDAKVVVKHLLEPFDAE